jgi:pSer/pThr/pTyr-binding forkhead associated (FHA) protein
MTGFTLAIVSGGVGSFSLREGDTRIGRNPKVDIVLSHMSVARLHAEISIRGPHVQIRDLGTRIGTFVNGKQVENSQLQPGDEITIGHVVLHLRHEGDTAQSN